jgi:hypothetical protein
MAAGLLLSGCAGVTPLPTRTKTPANEVLKQKVSANFIVAGQTTKAEVLAKLSSVDAEVEGDQFFLARWSSSNKGGWFFLCGNANCVGNAARLWKTANALVEFDDQDLVARYAVFGDGSLVARLSPLAAKQMTVDFDHPQTLYVQIENLQYGGTSATLILGRDTFELRGTEYTRGIRHPTKRSADFETNRAAVANVRIRVGGVFPLIPLQIRFNEKTRIGKKMNVQMSVPDLFLLLEYLNQRPQEDWLCAMASLPPCPEVLQLCQLRTVFLTEPTCLRPLEDRLGTSSCAIEGAWPSSCLA